MLSGALLTLKELRNCAWRVQRRAKDFSTLSVTAKPFWNVSFDKTRGMAQGTRRWLEAGKNAPVTNTILCLQVLQCPVMLLSCGCLIFQSISQESSCWFGLRMWTFSPSLPLSCPAHRQCQEGTRSVRHLDALSCCIPWISMIQVHHICNAENTQACLSFPA